MRITVSALIALLAVSLSTTAQENGTPRAVALHITSLNTGFAMQGDFEGEYRIHPDRVELKVARADIRISEHCPYKGRRLLSGVNIGLATNIEDGRWKIAYHGQPVSVERVMRPGDAVSLGELHYNIPIDGSVDLSKHWLVVYMEDTVLDVPGEKRVKGRAYAHSDKGIFSQPG